MSSYVVKYPTDMVRQEGADNDAVFTVPSQINLTGTPSAIFEATDTLGNIIITKTSATGGGITIASPTITVVINPYEII